MLTLLISLLISLGCSFACIANGLGKGAAITCGITLFIVALIVIGFLIRKKTERINQELQDVMASGQKRLSHKVHQMQFKPGGNPAVMQRQIENEQMGLIKQALDFTVKLEPMKKWNVLMGRQIATMRMQFLYQLKEFEEVDKLIAAKGLFSGPMLMEPLPVAMKMARQYKNKDIEAAEKTFKRHVKWFKGSRATLLYGLLSWIYVKNGDAEKARELLSKGKEVTSNEVLTRNWEWLSNNKAKNFSNAGLGDEWFSLYLDKMPAIKQKRVRGNPKGGRRF